MPWGEVKMALLSKTSSVTHLVNVLLFLMVVQAQRKKLYLQRRSFANKLRDGDFLPAQLWQL